MKAWAREHYSCVLCALIAIDVTVPYRGLSVCLSITFNCIVLKRHKTSILFLLHTIALCLSQIVLKFGLHPSSCQPFLLWFGPKVTHPPVDFSVGDNWWQIAAEWSEIAQRSQWRAYRKPPLLFRMVPSLTPLTSHSPKMVVPNAPPTSNFATSAATWRIW